jgi:triacylglycerol lipase
LIEAHHQYTNFELYLYNNIGRQTMAGVTQPPYPLHPSISSRIHPEYAAFYNEYIINQQQVHLQPVAASRTSGVLIPGGGPVLQVGKTEDIAIKRVESEGPDVLVRVFTPEEPAPEGGYGVMLYMHGGGWVLGNINTENTVCTNICKRAGVVVVSVDYRFVLPPFLLLTFSPSLYLGSQ